MLPPIPHQSRKDEELKLSNRPAYRTNPEETKETESQVQDLLEKGWVQKSLSPYDVHVLLMPKKRWQVENVL